MMRVLHILDHSIPLHSGYTFRSAALLAGTTRARLGNISPYLSKAR